MSSKKSAKKKSVRRKVQEVIDGEPTIILQKTMQKNCYGKNQNNKSDINE